MSPRVIALKTLLCTLLLGLQACSGGNNNSENPINSTPTNAPTTVPSSTPSPSPVEVGITQRPENEKCFAFADQSASINLTPVFTTVDFANPLLMIRAPGDDSSWYVAQQNGIILNIDDQGKDTIFFDIGAAGLPIANQNNTDNCFECGLLGMAFDPDFESNGHVYLSWTIPENNPETKGVISSTVERFSINDSGNSLDAVTRRGIYTVVQPYNNHNGGHIVFGSDNKLYVGLGDGGSGNDPDDNGQKLDTALGSILRLNKDGSAANGNILASTGTLPEIYAYGLRNPWRFSFDSLNNELWLADVGQSSHEEVNIIVNGGNYGWRCKEANRVTNNGCDSDVSTFIDPITEYGRSEGQSVTGGYVYRGSSVPGLQGNYVFGDFRSGLIWRLPVTGANRYQRQLLLESSYQISSFAQDTNGELYVLSFDEGIFRIDADNQYNTSVPRTLSTTGCFAENDPTQATDSLIPYTVNEPFWSDGAEKERFFALPENAYINFDSDGGFIFPQGSVLAKHFRLNNRIIETRLFMHQQNGWAGYSYEWNQNQSEAILVEGAKDVEIDGQIWHYPSGIECLQCHTEAANFALGLEVRQLNRNYEYPQSGVTSNQLSTLEHIDIFNQTIPAIAVNPLIASTEQNASLDERARTYLHTNCSQCHRPGTNSRSDLNLLITTSLAETNSCNQAPQLGDLGITAAKIIAPGNADNSILLTRMLRLDDNRMPPSSSTVVDEDAVSLLTAWINSLDNCL